MCSQPGPHHICQPMSSHCDSSTPSCTTDSTGGSSTSCGGSPAVEELVELFDCLSPSLGGSTIDGRGSFSVLPPPRLPSLHTQQRIPVQYRRYSSSTPYCDEDPDSSGSDEMEATARAIRALAPQRRRPYQTVSRSANLLTTPAVGSPKPQVRAVDDPTYSCTVRTNWPAGRRLRGSAVCMRDRTRHVARVESCRQSK